MNDIVGASNNGEDLPELEHATNQPMAFGVLPSKVAKKVQYKEELITQGKRVQLQKERLAILLYSYEEKIRNVVVKDLKLRQQYVTTYLSQTRYSLAQLLDKSVRQSK